MTNFNKVGTFMRTFGQDVLIRPTLPNVELANLRVELIREEFVELQEALEAKDIVEIADALTDILYVVYGAGHAFGIPLDKCFNEVHGSNMSKTDSNGRPIYRDDGKVLKGENYYKPNLAPLLIEQ